MVYERTKDTNKESSNTTESFSSIALTIWLKWETFEMPFNTSQKCSLRNEIQMLKLAVGRDQTQNSIHVGAGILGAFIISGKKLEDLTEKIEHQNQIYQWGAWLKT